MKNLDSTEIAAYRAKQGVAFKNLTPELGVLATELLIQKLVVIAGVNTGQGKLFDTVADEIYDFIRFIPAFAYLTLDEIVLAFRMNAAGKLGERVEHFNAVLNCDYVGKVLEKYVKIRQSIEDKELYAFPDTKQLVYNEELDADRFVEDCKEAYFATKKTGLISEIVYDILEEKGQINLTREQKQSIKNRIMSRMDNEALAGGLNAARKLKDLKSDRTKYDCYVKLECKREAVAQYFDQEHTLPKSKTE